MSGKIYLDLLIFCGIWSLGIIGAFADENIGESSSLLVRQKRVVSSIPGEDRPVRIEDHPYVVHIKKFNRIHCVGTILSNHVIITAAECGQYFLTSEFKVISKSARTCRGTAHNVTEIKLHYGNHMDRPTDGIALFTIDPPIVYNRYSNKIDVHVGRLPPGMVGIVSGWGYDTNKGDPRGTKFPTELRSIQVPVMPHQECVNRYRQIYHISDQDICTFHPLKHSGHIDAGAPLVVNNILVGIFLRRGPIGNLWNTQYPDVFAFLQHTHYYEWIRTNI